VYMKSGGENQIDLVDHNTTFRVHWFNPRSGGELHRGSIETIAGPGLRDIGSAPVNVNKDWLAVIRRMDR
ncbi:MAG TPA: DUF5060 domain-containing protein, partial [bacterium]|nr:DUF5060 domain-containing protein [bacterium]